MTERKLLNDQLLSIRVSVLQSQVDDSTFPKGKVAKVSGGAERPENSPVGSFQ